MKARSESGFAAVIFLRRRLPGLTSIPDPGQHESFFPRKRLRKKSYIEDKLKQKIVDKVGLAIECSHHMTEEVMAGRFDWEEQMVNIIERIKSWNT